MKPLCFMYGIEIHCSSFQNCNHATLDQSVFCIVWKNEVNNTLIQGNFLCTVSYENISVWRSQGVGQINRSYSFMWSVGIECHISFRLLCHQMLLLCFWNYDSLKGFTTAHSRFWWAKISSEKSLILMVGGFCGWW